MAVRRKVTLADVAERARVSATTASYILNGRAPEMRISADAEGRVRQAAADLRYRPNRSARVLRTGGGRLASRTIAVVSDHLAGGAFASRMLDGARDAARERDHLLVVGETAGDGAMAVRVIEEMLDRQVDGIVYATLVTGTVAVPPVLHQTSAVLLNCVDPTSGMPSVLPDELAGGATAAAVVLDVLRARAALPVPGGRGTDRSVWIVGEDEDSSALSGPLRQEGLCRSLRAAGVEVAGVVPCAWSVVPAYDAVSAWLAAWPAASPSAARPDVLVCLNDRIAMGTYQALAEVGLAVPRDVSVISFDGSELASWLRPAVTSVAIPYAEMGALAVRALLEPDAVTPGPDGVVRVPMPLRAGRSVTTGSPLHPLADAAGAGPASPDRAIVPTAGLRLQ